MPGPRNQQISVTQGEIDDYKARIAELEANAAPDTSAIQRDLDVANMKDIADLTVANAALTAKNAELQSEIEATRAVMK